MKTKKIGGMFAMVLAGVFFWLYGLGAGLLWLLFLLFFVYEWESWVIGVVALIILTSCPILLLFNQNTWSEAMTVYAYFFLVMTVVLQIIECKRHLNKYAKN